MKMGDLIKKYIKRKDYFYRLRKKKIVKNF